MVIIAKPNRSRNRQTEKTIRMLDVRFVLALSKLSSKIKDEDQSLRSQDEKCSFRLRLKSGDSKVKVKLGKPLTAQCGKLQTDCTTQRDQPLRPTQPSTLSGTENKYRPKCADALRLRNKGGYGSFMLWTCWWQVKLCT